MWRARATLRNDQPAVKDFLEEAILQGYIHWIIARTAKPITKFFLCAATVQYTLVASSRTTSVWQTARHPQAVLHLCWTLSVAAKLRHMWRPQGSMLEGGSLQGSKGLSQSGFKHTFILWEANVTVVIKQLGRVWRGVVCWEFLKFERVIHKVVCIEHMGSQPVHVGKVRSWKSDVLQMKSQNRRMNKNRTPSFRRMMKNEWSWSCTLYYNVLW